MNVTRDVHDRKRSHSGPRFEQLIYELRHAASAGPRVALHDCEACDVDEYLEPAKGSSRCERANNRSARREVASEEWGAARRAVPTATASASWVVMGHDRTREDHPPAADDPVDEG